MNNHCQLSGLCSLLMGPYKRPLSSEQVPRSHLSLGYHQLRPPTGCVDLMASPQNPFLVFCHWGSCKASLPSSFSCMAASSHRKHFMSSSSFGKGPKSSSAEGCPATWSSSDVDSGSWKVMPQCCLVVLGLGNWA